MLSGNGEHSHTFFLCTLFWSFLFMSLGFGICMQSTIFFVGCLRSGACHRICHNANMLFSFRFFLSSSTRCHLVMFAFSRCSNTQHRLNLSTKWIEKCAEFEIPCSEHFGLSHILSDSIEIRQWTLNGLPVDALATENAIIVTNVLRYPLIIDPQGTFIAIVTVSIVFHVDLIIWLRIWYCRASESMDKEHRTRKWIDRCSMHQCELYWYYHWGYFDGSDCFTGEFP